GRPHTRSPPGGGPDPPPPPAPPRPLPARGPPRRILDAAARRTAEEGIELSEALRTARHGDTTLEAALPEARLRQLLDPADHMGSAGALVDRALERTVHTPQEPV
ncbi:hypothetical protein ACFW1M_13365, partial [Streptomyces inhibens]